MFQVFFQRFNVFISIGRDDFRFEKDLLMKRHLIFVLKKCGADERRQG